tara:strand:- start:390 stop:638 length:249 start_codon:yes stop_codon:yes gene_type:complete
MDFDDVLLLDYIYGIPGNAIVYLFLIEYKEFNEWLDDDWNKTKQSYYKKVENPGIAWLHDIFKNRCKYDKDKCVNFIQQLRK